MITLLSHPWTTLNPTVAASNWGLRAKRISDKMAKRAVSCTWASTVEGVLMGAVFRGRSTLQAEFLNPWASQLEQSYCALQGLLDLNRKHPKSMKFLLDSRVSCVCWSRLLYHSEKEHAYTMQYSHSPANFMRFPLKSQNYFHHPGWFQVLDQQRQRICAPRIPLTWRLQNPFTPPHDHDITPGSPQPAVNIFHISTMFYQYTRASTFETFSFHLCPMFWQETDLWIQKKHTSWGTAHPVNHDKNTSKYMSCDCVTSVTLSSFQWHFSVSRQRTGLSPLAEVSRHEGS